MTFLLEFMRVFLTALLYCLPIIAALLLMIVCVGLLIGRREKWSRSNSIYYAFITATTVGYGDFHPKHPRSRYMAIVIAFLGLLLTGIIVAIGVNATGSALTKTYSLEGEQDKVKSVEKN